MAVRPVELSVLRRAIATLEPSGASCTVEPFGLGLPALDAWLGGGLARGALHEVYALRAVDAAAAGGFGLGVALKAGSGRSVVWVRQDRVGAETGQPCGDGLAAFGVDPERLLVVRVRDPTGILRATAEAVRCAAIGATLVEIWGEPKGLDLTASRRLALAAAGSGVTLIMVRLAASPEPSAATSRWSVTSSPSKALEANAPGGPAFAATLLRHRAGLGPRTWRLEWDRDSASFVPPASSAPIPRPVVPVPAGRSVPADPGARRSRAG